MMKNVAVTAESNAVQKIQEATAKFENEKRRLFSLAADKFISYFNVSATIDERAYQTLLRKVKSDLKRLSQSESVVRRLVGPDPDNRRRM
jgi:hypothetical protein